MKTFIISLSIVIFLFLTGCSVPYMNYSCDKLKNEYVSARVYNYAIVHYPPQNKKIPTIVAVPLVIVIDAVFIPLCIVSPPGCTMFNPFSIIYKHPSEKDFLEIEDAYIKKNCPYKDEILQKRQDRENYGKIDSK